MKHLFFFCFFLLAIFVAEAQTTLPLSKINGKVLTSENYPFGNVIVFNVRKGLKTVTNSKGQFSIIMEKYDTIYFIFSGYISKRMFFTKDNSRASYNISFTLNMDKEILLKKYMQNRMNEEPVNTSIIKPKSETHPYTLPSIELTKGGSKEPYKPNAIENPISFLYDRYNKVARTRRKLEKNREYRAKKYGDTLNVEKFEKH